MSKEAAVRTESAVKGGWWVQTDCTLVLVFWSRLLYEIGVQKWIYVENETWRNWYSTTQDRQQAPLKISIATKKRLGSSTIASLFEDRVSQVYLPLR